MAQNEYAFRKRDIDNILRQNKEWAKSRIKVDEFSRRSDGVLSKRPSYLWIGELFGFIEKNF